MAKQPKAMPDASVLESLQRCGWRVVGAFEVRDHARGGRLNESGQSSVFRVEHTIKGAGVLKVSHGGMQEMRIRRETDIMQRVPHSAIVPILDAGVDCDPPWLITAEGTPLTKAWDRSSMSNDIRFERAQRVILQLAAGLEVAHAKGVVHRDLKPENVVFMRDGAEESAALIDFGIAYDEHAPRLTEADARAVANQFAAPPGRTMAPSLIHRVGGTASGSLGCGAG
jgi:serine/threonine protein kinase